MVSEKHTTNNPVDNPILFRSLNHDINAFVFSACPCVRVHLCHCVRVFVYLYANVFRGKINVLWYTASVVHLFCVSVYMCVHICSVCVHAMQRWVQFSIHSKVKDIQRQTSIRCFSGAFECDNRRLMADSTSSHSALGVRVSVFPTCSAPLASSLPGFVDCCFSMTVPMTGVYNRENDAHRFSLLSRPLPQLFLPNYVRSESKFDIFQGSSTNGQEKWKEIENSASVEGWTRLMRATAGVLAEKLDCELEATILFIRYSSGVPGSNNISKNWVLFQNRFFGAK